MAKKPRSDEVQEIEARLTRDGEYIARAQADLKQEIADGMFEKRVAEFENRRWEKDEDSS